MPPPTMTFGNDDLMEFVTRYQALQVQRDSNDALIKDLLIYCERIENGLREENKQLQAALRDAQFDLEDARKSRREFQHRLVSQEHDMKSLAHTHLKNRHPYVVILIDGDGTLFKNAFIKQGIEGGKKAAYALRSIIANECGEEDVEVVCNVYANLAGLSKAMKRDGSLELEADMKDFSLGFTQAKASFDFIDVGHGKERADSKIKEGTRWHLRNVNCRQVLLGVSHDAGYAPFLDEILRDDETRSRVTIAEGFPTVREIRATSVNILNFTEHIFRSDKLVDRVIHRLPTPPTSFASPSAASAASIASASSGAPVSTAPSSTPSAPNSYAGVAGSASPPPTIILPFANKQKTTPVQRPAAPKPAPWNPGPRGIDPPIAVNQNVLDNIKKRRDGDKLCNNHYLRGPCQKGDACVFEHNYKPNADEKVAISFLARLNPCTNGQDCDTEDCIYGHHCPSVRDGQCTHPYCKFRPDEHPPNTKFKNSYTFNNY